ncbi:hypothetical protein RhiirA4_493986 [Rhizophagus irregularis]|uniref:Uncharacterized protein n=1 Tax=Rhizophagus irregularis TaxID=588596 RepID=A0A2I1GY80_9GLOM|nr:hypothetical protein RhiirA4_493986 [Rhizophagus irregularis]
MEMGKGEGLSKKIISENVLPGRTLDQIRNKFGKLRETYLQKKKKANRIDLVLTNGRNFVTEKENQQELKVWTKREGRTKGKNGTKREGRMKGKGKGNEKGGGERKGKGKGTKNLDNSFNALNLVFNLPKACSTTTLCFE